MPTKFATANFWSEDSRGVRTNWTGLVEAGFTSAPQPPNQFRKKPRPSLFHQTNYARSSVDLSAQQAASYTDTYSTYKTGGQGFVNIGMCVLGISPKAPFNRLESELLSNIKGQKANFAVSLAELGKTTDMVFGLTRQVFSAYRHLRKRGMNFADFDLYIRNRVDKDASNAWLQYIYGWIPTASDIYALSQVHQQNAQRLAIQRVSSSTTERFHRQRTTATVVQTTESVGHYRMGAYITPSNLPLADLARAGFTNPAAFAYELIPFSFVADWILPVGKYLGNLDALAGISVNATYRASRIEATSTIIFHGVSAGVRHYTVPGVSILKEKSYSRGANPPLRPFRNFPTRLTIPGSAQLLNLVALFDQRR